MSEMKKCANCKLEMDTSNFYNEKGRTDGKMRRCKDCMKKKSIFWKDEKNNRKANLLERHEYPEFNKLSKRAREIVEAYIENPKITYAQLAEKLDTTVSAVAEFHSSNAYVHALRMVATNKISQMIPMAVKTLGNVMEMGTSNVQLNAAVKVLENENVVGPSRVDINVTDWRSLPIDRLQQMLAEAKAIPPQTIDAEIVHD